MSVSTSIRVAAEQLAAARLAAVDSHAWMQFYLPRATWICTDCWLSLEATAGRRCIGAPPMA